MITPIRYLAIATVLCASVSGTALADAANNTLRVAFAEEILNLDYNYTTKREYIIRTH